MRRVVCPGTFDPVTRGHADIVARAAAMFDEVVVAVGTNTSKNAIFSLDERLEMIAETFADLPTVSARPLSGLIIDFAREVEATAIVKGLRFAADFDYELQMAQLNREMSGIETVWLPTAAEWGFVSSTMIREIASLGGDVERFVPAGAARRLRRRFPLTTKENDD